MHTLQIYSKKFTNWHDSEQVFITFFGKKDNTFWLDSSRVEEGLSRFSYMGEAGDVLSFSVDGNQNVFDELSRQLRKLSVESTNFPFDFVGGFVGYFGYEIKAFCGSKNTKKSSFPDSLWFFVDSFLVFDHREKDVYAVCLTAEKNKAEKWFAKVENEFKKVSQRTVSKRHVDQPIPFQLSRSHDQYLKDVETCKKYLASGESYQICLTNTLTTTIDINPLDLYLTLRSVNPAPYAAFIKHKDVAILCSSPERFLKITQDRIVESKPIKGTNKRSSNKQEDARLAENLLNSEKDRAENLMITDLLRNDLGKVCEIGSVTVPKLMAIESYQTVHQLVSTVRGKLKKDVSVIDCIQACFPGGSMTGAPKLRTMEILDTIEKNSRGIYSGCLGFLSANGATDLNIVIRTITKKGKVLSIGAGGAILIQSDPEKEYQEMMLKAEPLLNAIIKTAGKDSYTIT